MDSGASKREARMVELLALVEERGTVSLAELARVLCTSPATIRRDVAQLAAEQLLVRSHGAVSWPEHDNELPVRLRDAHNRAAKRAIAGAAVRLLPAGRHAVALTGGTTTTEVMRALRDRDDLTIITNSLTLATEAAEQGQSRVLVAGGVLRPNSQELVGRLAESTFNQVNVGTAVVGADGVSVEGGLTTHDDVEARTNHTMIARAQRVVAVVDGSKLGRVMLAQLARLDEIDHLVTDASADPDELERIRRAGVQVIVVDAGPAS